MVTVYPGYENYEKTLTHLKSLGLEDQLYRSPYAAVYDDEYDERGNRIFRSVPTQKLEKPLTFIQFGNAERK